MFDEEWGSKGSSIYDDKQIAFKPRVTAIQENNKEYQCANEEHHTAELSEIEVRILVHRQPNDHRKGHNKECNLC